MAQLEQIESCLRSQAVARVLLSELKQREINRFASRAIGVLEASKALSQLEPLSDREVRGACKSLTDALQSKEAAGKAFKRGDFREAAEAYSRSLQFAPAEGNGGRELLGTLFANRALCCLKLRHSAVAGSCKALLDASCGV